MASVVLSAITAFVSSPEVASWLVAIAVIAVTMLLWHRRGEDTARSVDSMLGLEFDDAETERAYREQREQDIATEGRQYLNIVPFTATAFLLTGQYPMFFFAASCLPFFWIPIPSWAWMMLGQYPGTIVQIASWHFFPTMHTVTIDALGPAMALTMACQANGRVCFPSWSGFAVQQAIVLACQTRFAWRATGGRAQHFGVVVSLFAIIAIWTLQHHFIMLRDRRKSFLRLHLNRKLQKDVTLYAKAVEVMGKGLIVASAECEIVHVNKTWCQISGFAKEDVVGKREFVEKCCFAGDLTDKRETDAVARAIAGGLPFVGELRAYRKDGTEFWCELTVRPVKDDAGTTQQFIATIDDVTEKVRQSHIIYSQKMFIGSQAKLTADSAFGAARSLASARAMIAAQSAENAMLNETIQILRDEVAEMDAIRGSKSEAGDSGGSSGREQRQGDD